MECRSIIIRGNKKTGWTLEYHPVSFDSTDKRLSNLFCEAGIRNYVIQTAELL
jgi:hypothetical protein